MNKFLLIFLAIFGVIGFFAVWFLLVDWIMETYKEAKENKKRVEFSSLIISISAFILAGLSLFLTLIK